LGDFFRWNITETCLALTMFRHELTVTSCVFFLFLVLGKCLHWVAELREGHLRMTQETFVLRTSGIFTFVPKIHPAHRGVISMIHLLICIDIIVVVYCIQEIVTNGESVIILFGFEAGIMTVSAISSLFLWHMHAIDSLLQYLHDETSVNVNAILHAWKDRKATITFAIEVQAQGAKFLLYCTFFAIVFTHYGLPINLFRELYMSFQALKQRVLAFAKYRRLMSNMNRFSNVSSEQELEETGKTCIICRDEMTIRDCKKLPGCGHCFHKSCLREWLVQQQTCPTCRGDITANAERERKRKREEAQAEAERNAARNDDDDDDEEEEEIGPKESIQAPPEETKDNNSTSPVQPSQTTGVARSPQPTLIKIQSRSTLRLSKKQSIESKSESKKTKTKAKASSVLPAFYLVTSEEGAIVHNLETGETVRVVSKGIALFCTKLDLQNFRDEPGLMLKIPDGWVMESDVEFVSSVGLYT